MMSLAYIQELADQQARRAARAKKRPYVIYDNDEIDRMPPLPFPNLGSYRPRGWKYLLDRDLFIDSTGFGSENEPALTVRGVKEKLRELEREADERGATYGYAIIESGQFQCFIGVFEKREARRRAGPGARNIERMPEPVRAMIED